jgi:hypothetical protein
MEQEAIIMFGFEAIPVRLFCVPKFGRQGRMNEASETQEIRHISLKKASMLLHAD